MKYSSLFKRTIAMVMSVVMTVSMLPLSALAQDTPHTHSDDCYEAYLTCGVEKGAVHTHDDSCYTVENHTVCGLVETEGHTHTDECYQTEDVLICKQEETEGHTHSDSCYDEREELTCGQAEKDAHAHGEGCYESEKVLKCTQQVEPHTHEEKCWKEDSVLTCTESTEPHVHTDDCYGKKLVCEFADANPDGETGDPEQGSGADAYTVLSGKVAELPPVEKIAEMTDDEKQALVETLIALQEELDALLDEEAITMEQYEALALPMMKLNEAIIGSAAATLDLDDIPMESYITGISITIGNNVYKPDANGVFSGFTVTKNDQIGLVIDFKNVTVHKNETDVQAVVYQIPNGIFQSIAEHTNIQILDDEEVVGYASVFSDGRVVFQPTADYITTHHDSGDDNAATLQNNSIRIEGQLADRMGNEPGPTDNVFHLANKDYTLPFDYSDHYSRLSVNKSHAVFNPKEKTLTYTVTVHNDGEQTSNNVKVADVFTESFAHIEKVNNRYYNNVTASVGNFVQSGSSTQAEWIIGSLEPGATATLTYTVKLSDGYFNAGSPNVSNKATVTWGKKGSNEVTVSDAFNGVLNIEKTHANPYVADDGTSRIRYTVTVKAPATNTAAMENVTVEDKLPIGARRIAGGYEVVSVEPAESAATPNVDAQTVNWTIGTMLPNTSATMVYDVILNPEYLMEGSGTYTEKRFDNTATVKQNGEPYDYAVSQAVIRKEWIGKSGVKQSDGRIKFNVTVNKFANGVGAFTAVKTLEDTITGSFAFSGDIVVNVKDKSGTVIGTQTIPAADVVVAGTDNKKIRIDFAQKLPASLIGPYQYEVEYFASPTSSVAVISNTATVGIGVGDGGATWSHSATASGSGGFSFAIEKSLLGGTPDNVNWQTKIKTFIPEGSVFTDRDPTGYPTNPWHSDKRFNFTQAHLDGIVITDGDGHTLTSGEDYTVTGMRNEQVTDGSVAYYGFTITFLRDINGSASNPVIVRYSSETNSNVTGLADNTVISTFRNVSTMSIYGISANSQANYQSRYFNPLKKAVQTVDYSAGTVTWLVTLNGGSSIEGNGTLIEKIPEGLEFVSATITERGSMAGNTTLGIPVVETSSEDGVGQQVSIPVYDLYRENGLSGQATNGRVAIQVVTKITDSELLNGKDASDTQNNLGSTVSSHVSKQFANRVQFVQPGKPTLEAAAETTLENTPLSKSANIDLNTRPYVAYSVKVNENSIDMLANSTVITVVDEMSENMNLALDAAHRLKVTKLSDGADITAQCILAVGAGGHGFRLQVPDNVGLLVQYYVTISGVEGSSQNINNRVYYEGSSTGINSIINNFTVTKGAATTDTGGAFKILKLDQDGNPVKGVEFKIYKVVLDSSSADYNHTTHDGPAVGGTNPQLELIATRTTDENGVINLRPNELNDPAKFAIYVYQETSAPAGYLKDTAKHYVQFSPHPIFAASSGISPVGITVNATVQVYNKFTQAELTVPVVKRLTEYTEATGGATNNETFTFTMVKTSGENCFTPQGNAFTEAEVSVTGSGSVSFPKLSFSKAGEYKFTIRENALTQEQLAAGYTHDDAVYTLTATVAVAADNTLSVSGMLSKNNGDPVPLNSGNLPIFDNGYKINGQVIVPIQKTVSGMTGTQANNKSFQFVLYRANNKYESVGLPLSTVNITVGSTNTGTGVFDALKFSTDKSAADSLGGVGTYYFLMREQPAGGGFLPNNTTHTLRVVVSANGSNAGKLNFQVYLDSELVSVNSDNTLASSAEWTNVYNPTPSSFVVAANKTLNGHASGGFSVELIDNNEDSVRDGITCAVPERNAKGQRIISDAFDSYGNAVLNLGNMITFTKAGTYRYKMQEINDGQPGVTYDTRVFDVIVTVSDDGNGTLSSEVAYQLNGVAQSTVSFANTYNAEGFAEIKAEKHLSGRDWKTTDVFTFTLTPVDGAPLRTVAANGFASTVTQLTASATKDSREMDFGRIRFEYADLDGESEKIFDYVIHETSLGITDETNANYNGITNAADRIVRIKVSDENHNGQLAVTYAAYNNDGNLTNEYLQTIDAPDLINIYHAKSATADIQAVKKIMDKNGTELTNWTTTGHNWSTTQFRFRLERTRDTTPMPAGTNGEYAYATVTNKTAVWENIEFTAVGEYDYIIREMIEVDGYNGPVTTDHDIKEGLLYDVAVHSAKVIVSDDMNGHLTTQVVYYRGTAGQTGNAPIFYNRDLPDGFAILSIGKTLEGAKLRDGEFSFELYNSNESGVTGTYIENASVLVTDAENNKGTVEFGAITYNWHEGDVDHYYLIKEKSTGNSAMQNKTGDILVKVTVTGTVATDNSHSMNTVAAYFVKNTAGEWVDTVNPVIENEYTSSGTAVLTVSKHIEGRDFWTDADEFTFTLSGKNGAPVHLADGETTARVTANKVNRIVSFPQLNFTQADMNNQISVDYVYTIREEEPTDKKGMTYAADVDVTVRLTDDGQGHITAQYKVGNRDFTNVAMNAQFDNIYTVSSTTAELKATKRLAGRDWLATDTFSFAVVPVSNTAGIALAQQPMPTNTTVSVTNQSTAVAGTTDSFTGSFGTITYAKPGIYQYDIAEQIPADRISGISYSTAVHRVTVTVTDNGDGTMSSLVHYAGTNSTTPAAFTNTYAPASTSLAIQGRKIMLGRGLEAHKYFFSLYEADQDFNVTNSAPLYRGSAAAAMEGESGAIDQTTFIYDHPGDYYYVLREDIPAGTQTADGKTVKDGVTFDTHDVKITVTVTDNLDGTMTAVAVYDNTDALVDADKTVSDKAAFTNVYKAEGHTQLRVTKELTSELGWDLEESGFSFRLTPASDTVPFRVKVNNQVVAQDTPAKRVLTATATKNYVVASFDDLWFNESDIGSVYEYYIEEIFPEGTNPNNHVHNSITYNPERISVLVRVDDGGTGKLNISVSYNGKDSIIVINRFERVEVAGIKNWADGTTHNNAQDITLKLYRESKDPTAPNKTLMTGVTPVWSDNTYMFENLAKYDAKGFEYVYTIEEQRVNGYYAGVVTGYDITNTPYTATGSVTLTATKVLTGGRDKDIQANEFSFVVRDAGGKTVSTGKNAADGSITFTPITYTQADLGEDLAPKTYTYTVSEVTGTDASITYSAEVYKVSVTVAPADASFDSAHDDAHKLTCTVTKADSADAAVDDMVFHNVYNTGSLKITKTVLGNLGSKTKEFTFKVTLSCEGEYAYTGSKTGTITSGGTVKLKHGESITIAGLPAGTEYTVTESDNAGYAVKTTNDEGTIVMDKTVVASFENTKSSVPKTGDGSNFIQWVAAMVACLVGAAAALFFLLKRRSRYHN